ncbi:MAG: ATP-binding protein [Acidobacteriota bacterium]
MPTANDYERLGAFYLGRAFDLRSQQGGEPLVLYDSKDLLTHGVCVGMTGSGKTGLCLALLEEAAIDGVPVIAIDPKGDLANLLLTFPGLSGEEFLPWINEDDARREGVSPPEWASSQAALWRKGLEKWGQDGDRIRRLRQSAEFRIYTPGSSAGLPVSILSSFAVPPAALLEDGEMLRERVSSTVTSLLGLAGIAVDPLRSREHILLSTIIGESWKEGRDLDLASMIQAIQQPSFKKVGVLDLESFYPGKDRFELAMSLNSLIAAPGFDAWLEGESLDIAGLLHSPTGRPRVSIISIAHLNDAERMFVVSLVLNQLLGWMRQQSGTTSLRALFYMDEIFGYFPPVANPPSKQPLLTLLKQARAFGLGLVLATQNPVDLDYKGLSNIGTWWIGRLQTERDKSRVMEGLEGAAASQGSRFDRRAMEQTLAGLGNRVFLMNNVHEDAPIVMETRWVMSYLRGPLTRSQIKQLMEGVKSDSAVEATKSPAAAQTPMQSPSMPAASQQRPLVPADITQYFVPLRSRPSAGQKLFYQPMVLGASEIHFVDAKVRIDTTQKLSLFAQITDEAIPVLWDQAIETGLDPSELERESPEQAEYSELPQTAARAKSYVAWSKDLVDFIFRNRTIDLLKSPHHGRFSTPDEGEREFRIRLQQLVREERDSEVEKLRQKYEPKIATIEDRIRRSQQTLEREQAEASGAKMDTLLGIGQTLLGGLFGRKTMSAGNFGRAASTARSASRAVRQSSDVGRAAETVESLTQQHGDLVAQFDEEVETLKARSDPALESFDLIQIKPKKKDISIRLIALIWVPHWRGTSGEVTPAWE